MLDPDHTNSLLCSACAARVAGVLRVARHDAQMREVGRRDSGPSRRRISRMLLHWRSFYAELDERLAAGDVLTESDAAQMLHAWRAKDPEFLKRVSQP